MTILVHGSPEISQLAVDPQENFIKVPLVPRLRAAVAPLVGVGLAELARPRAHGFIADLDAGRGKQVFNSAVAEGEAEGAPDRRSDHFGGVTRAFVEGRVRGGG